MAVVARRIPSFLRKEGPSRNEVAPHWKWSRIETVRSLAGGLLLVSCGYLRWVHPLPEQDDRGCGDLARYGTLPASLLFPRYT